MRWMALLTLVVSLSAAELQISEDNDFVVIEHTTGVKLLSLVAIRKTEILSTEVHEVEKSAELFVTTSELVPHGGAAVHRVHRFPLGSMRSAADAAQRITRLASGGG